MCKVSPNLVNGLEFVRLSCLPSSQAQQLNNWLPASSVIELKVDGRQKEACILYADYEVWYNYNYQTSSKINFERYL